ncbi:MAG TPA: MiaB/RimO family radical SAM methylthiotransferase [Candidatus Gastranaerophilaceae bacterium]|nr:MiaB/RimO family radical SAM methylthiotransferase [Candidatus Gastranaerophilaceae bacterium]
MNIFELKDFHKVLLDDTTKTRASVKIQDGCDNRCSYCIIPFARGKNRSADLDFILKQIKIYEQANFKEIMLTGIHIGQWRVNDSENNLLNLLRSIEEKTNISRFRLGSLNPLEIDDEMLEFLKNSQKFCPHFHLSIQSMCDKTLKTMNRHYTVAKTLDLIEKIHKNFDAPFIGSDIIAGFAGEGDEDFQITVENLKKSKLTQIHTFPYSVRKGTAAEKFENQVDLKTKNKRAAVIKQISAQKHEEFLQKNIGAIQEVLIEKNLDKKTGFLKGMTRNYINVLLDPQKYNFEKNTLYKIKIEKEHLVLG